MFNKLIKLFLKQDRPSSRQMSKSILDENQRFCDNPWIYCEIYAGGGVYICCPAWNYNKNIGNVYKNIYKDIWNSHQAQMFRKGILDGTFSECDREKCPALVSNSLPTMAAARTSWKGSVLSDAIDNQRFIATHGPSVVKIGYDASCNLTCPSCRTERIVAKRDERTKLDEIRDRFIFPLLRDAKILVLSSDGDPFASQHYRGIMKLTHDKFPNLKLGICTNGVLMDEHAWVDCNLESRVHIVQVSVDAARSETYDYVRRGGDFNRLLKNLHFISEKRHSSLGFSIFDLLFVVQACNFREMRAFVELGQKLRADSVQFMLIDCWGRAMTAEEYKKAKIWDRSHPDYAEFVNVIEDDIFRLPIVRLGGLEAILRDEQPPELQVDFETGNIRRSQ